MSYGVPQASVFKPLLFVLYTDSMWFGIANEMLAYGDEASHYADVPFPATRQIVAESLTEDLRITQSWCSRWGLKLNPIKSKERIVRRS